MKLLMGLFLAAKRSLMTRDSSADEFKSKLDELVNRNDGLSEAEVSSRVAELEKLTADIPDGDEKAKLTRFLEDFKAVKEQPPEVAKTASDGIFELYQSLCNEALKDSPESAAAPAGGNPDNGGKVEDDEAAAAATKETQAPAGVTRIMVCPKSNPRRQSLCNYFTSKDRNQTETPDQPPWCGQLLLYIKDCIDLKKKLY